MRNNCVALWRDSFWSEKPFARFLPTYWGEQLIKLPSHLRTHIYTLRIKMSDIFMCVCIAYGKNMNSESWLSFKYIHRYMFDTYMSHFWENWSVLPLLTFFILIRKTVYLYKNIKTDWCRGIFQMNLHNIWRSARLFHEIGVLPALVFDVCLKIKYWLVGLRHDDCTICKGSNPNQ